MELRTVLRFGVPVAWIAGSGALIGVIGIPTSHDFLYLWLASGMVAFSATDFRRRVPRLLREWLPLLAILMVYDMLRGVADGMLFPTHTTPQIHVEAALFGKPVPTVWLQQHLWHGAHHLQWWDYASWFVWLTHFLATPILAAILWTFFHDRYARYATMVCAVAVTGFATYLLYPAAPPWMAARQGDLGESHRVVQFAWQDVPIGHVGSLFEHGLRYSNNVAAMPSLHTAYAMLITLYLWRYTRWWLRIPLGLYPLAMSFALVYSGEHYVVDCVAGWIYAIGVYWGVERVFARRAKTVKVAELEPVYAD